MANRVAATEPKTFDLRASHAYRISFDASARKIGYGAEEVLRIGSFFSQKVLKMQRTEGRGTP